MRQRIIELGGVISPKRDNGDNYEVLGSNEVLQKIRKMLDENNYTDDGTAFAADFLGVTPATDNISRLFVCDYDKPGYLAIA